MAKEKVTMMYGWSEARDGAVLAPARRRPGTRVSLTANVLRIPVVECLSCQAHSKVIVASPIYNVKCS